MNSKKRKMYVPPTVEVVQLKMRNQLLAGSGGKGGLQNYTKHNYDPEEDE